LNKARLIYSSFRRAEMAGLAEIHGGAP
jgi:hypothetical protein